MDAERSPDETAAGRVEFKPPSLPENRERIIEICHELLSAGRPIAEIVEKAKRLSGDPIRNGTRFEPASPIELTATPLEQVPKSQATPDSSGPITHHGITRRLMRLSSPFVAVSVILLSLLTIAGYVHLGIAHQQTADHQNEDQLLRQLRERGQLISKSLRPALETAELKDVLQLGTALKLHAGGAQAVKLLFAPDGGESFYYAGSWPNDSKDFEAGRRELIRLGILDRLPGSCHAGAAFEVFGLGSSAGNEGVAVNPVLTPAGCWVVVSSFDSVSSPGDAPKTTAVLRGSGVQPTRLSRSH